jgi:aspartate carbamoyltransferase regulatory subunit
MKELKIQPIRNGTVIDHISPGLALKVLRIMGLPNEGTRSVISVAMNVTSPKTGGQKDVVKIEDREIDPREVNKIALIAPKATINIIRNFEVTTKKVVQLPKEIVGLAKCENASCISNTSEPIQTRFTVVKKDPPQLKCAYCGREVKDIAASLLD